MVKISKDSELFGALLSVTQDGYWVVDGGNRLTEVNEAYCSMSGYSREELIGMPMEKLVANVDQEDFKERLSEIRSMGSNIFYAHNRRKDGSIFPVEVTVSYLKEDDLYVSVCRDITEQERTAAELKHRMGELSCLYEISKLAETGWPAERIYTEASVLLQRAWYNPGDIAVVMVDPETEQSVADGTSDLKRRSLTVPVPVGGKVHGMISADCPAYDGQNEDDEKFLREVAERLGSIFDRIEAESRLRTNEMRWRGYVENAPYGIVISDSAGNFLDANPEALAITGYSRDQLLSMRLSDLLAESGRKKGEVLYKALEEDRTFNSDFSFVHGSGEERNFNLAGASLGKDRFITYMKDITQRLAREAEVQVYRNILEVAPALINIYNRSGKILYSNRAAWIKHGYDNREEFEALILRDLDDPESADSIPNRMDRLMNEGEAQFEVWHRKKDGSLFPLNVLSKLITWRGETSFLSIATDISLRKSVENELHESRRRLEVLMSNLPGMVYRCANTLSWPMTFISEGCKTLTGYAPEEMLPGGSIEYGDIIIPDDAGYVWEEIQQAVKEKRHFVLQYRICRKDGEVRWVWEQGRLVHGDDTGELEGFIQDITERKAAEDSLRQFKTIFDTANFGAAIATMDGVFTYVNKCFAADHGFEVDELVNQPLSTVHAESQLDVVKGSIREIMENGSFGPMEVGHRHKDGSLFPMLMTGTIIGDMNSPDYIAATAIDLKDVKALETQLMQAQKMESVGRLAGGVAHDFNNMLGVIIGHTELALDHLDTDDPLYSDLQQIRKAADRSADLTRQLLAFARKQTVVPRIMDLNEEVESSLKMLRRLIGENIQLDWIPGQLRSKIRIDPVQVGQILANLCVNARDAITSSEGRITIESSEKVLDDTFCMQHSGCMPGLHVLLKVSDNGAGIDPETRKMLFEPFYTTKEIGKGTGLGLATVYGIIKQNNGYIDVFSELGRGTEFIIYLPAYKGAEISDSPGDSEHGSREDYRTDGDNPETVMLVEDETTVLKLADMVLGKLGYKILGTSSPIDAIKKAEEYSGKIDLLITDVVMPEMNGRDLSIKLKSIHPEMKILFMSGYTADVIADHGVLEEGVNFIQKPFAMKDLGGRIREILSSVSGTDQN